jgi:hypothetical protein
MIHYHILLNFLVLDKSFEALDIIPNCRNNILCYDHAEAWLKKLVLSDDINWNLSASNIYHENHMCGLPRLQEKNNHCYLYRVTHIAKNV